MLSVSLPCFRNLFRLTAESSGFVGGDANLGFGVKYFDFKPSIPMNGVSIVKITLKGNF